MLPDRPIVRRTVWRNFTIIVVPFVVLAAIAIVGFIVQGWFGALVWPLAFSVIFAAFSITGLAFNAITSVRRGRVRIMGIQARLLPLSTDQLCELMRTPGHPDSQFALIELMQRGIDVRPTKEQLFGLLTSGNPNLCMDAMTNLEIFYPELPIPEGASNLDSPKIWRSRVEAFRNAN
jgi:hypothetical protein